MFGPLLFDFFFVTYINVASLDVAPTWTNPSAK